MLHVAVGALFDAIITRAHTPDRDFPHDMATLHCGFTGLAGSLTHETQLLFGHRALHPSYSTIIELTRIIDAIIIDEQRLSQRTHIDQMMPVAMVTGQP